VTPDEASSITAAGSEWTRSWRAARIVNESNSTSQNLASRRRYALISILVLTGVTQLTDILAQPAGSPTPEKPKIYQEKIPLGADEFLGRLVRLVDQRDGYVTPQSFEAIFGIPFAHHRTERDGTMVHWLVAGTDWYFDAGITETAPSFRMPGDPDFSGQISDFSIVWKTSVFPDLAANECITAGRFRKAFAGTRWQMPETWGKVPTAAVKRPIGAPLEEFAIKRSATFHLPDRPVLPEIQVQGSGDDASACISALLARARP